MNIEEISTGKIYPIEILPVEKSDYRSLTKARYFFNWKEEKDQQIYKLVIKGDNDILGLISFEIIREEWRIHIKLLTVSEENKGKDKKFNRIAGNLLCFVAKIAVMEFAEMACISLKPKTAIYKHYVDKYKMNITGTTLSLEVPEILNLIKEYESDS